MIGQHIYSRCLEGYFSTASLNADTTTVTITRGMFPREEQERKVAAECEKISTLEDSRLVPTDVQGAYRGVLKIHRLGRQISVICRSYRLHSGNGGANGFASGEHRDFTFSSNYILTGPDKARFFETPEYCLNLRDFEPYPSITNRIEESRRMNRNGRIEANPAYSLFNSELRPVSLDIFTDLGFTKELFVQYISSLIERIAYSTRPGYENGKVLVILPDSMNIPWDRSGGNKYAEQLLMATIKVLPGFLRSHLNATTGGQKDPRANVLNGYQLVFMENGPVNEWRTSEHSIIDLSRKTSYVKDGIDKSYAQFLWDNLHDEKKREAFAQSYLDLFGIDAIEKGDNTPEKFTYVLKIWEEDQNEFSDPRKRVQYALELIKFSKDTWTEKAANMLSNALTKECDEPTYSKTLEKTILSLIKRKSCPPAVRERALALFIQYILEGTAEQETVDWIYQGVDKNSPVVKAQVEALNTEVNEHPTVNWELNPSLMHLYQQISNNQNIPFSDLVKQGVYENISAWSQKYKAQKSWESAFKVTKLLKPYLLTEDIPESATREIYKKLIFFVLADNAAIRREASTILDELCVKFETEPVQRSMFWDCLKETLQSVGTLSEEAISCLVSAVQIRNSRFNTTEWIELCRELAERFVALRPELIINGVMDSLISRIRKGNAEQKMIYGELLAMYSSVCLENEKISYAIQMTQLEENIKALEEIGMSRKAWDLLYTRYSTEQTNEDKMAFIMKKLSTEEQWKLLIVWAIKNPTEEVLSSLYQQKLNSAPRERKTLLSNIQIYEFYSYEEQETLAKIYIELLKADSLRARMTNAEMLERFCTDFGKDYTVLLKNNKIKDFKLNIRKEFLNAIDVYEAVDFIGISEQSVKLLTSISEKNENPKFRCVQMISAINALNPSSGLSEINDLRVEISKETDANAKRAYQDYLRNKQAEIAPYDNDALYGISLLISMLEMSTQGRNDSWFRDLAEELSPDSRDSQNQLYTALRLLNVMKESEAEDHLVSSPAFAYADRYKELAGWTAEQARRTPEDFEDDTILKEYKRLYKQDRNNPNITGIRSYMKNLSPEWQEKYGFKRPSRNSSKNGSRNEYGSSTPEYAQEEYRSGSAMPIIFGILFTILGIGAAAAFFVLYDKIGGAAFITAAGLLGVGILGNLIAIIVALVKGRTARGSGISTMFTIFSLLTITGLLLFGVVFMKQTAEISSLDDQISKEAVNKDQIEQEKAELQAEKESVQSQITQIEEELERQRLEKERKDAKTQYSTTGNMEELGAAMKELVYEWPEDWSVYVRTLSDEAEVLGNPNALNFNGKQMQTSNFLGLYCIDAAYYLGYTGDRYVDWTDLDQIKILQGDTEQINTLLARVGGGDSGDSEAGKTVMKSYWNALGMNDTVFGTDFNENLTTAKDISLFMMNLYNNREVSGRNTDVIREDLASEPKTDLLILGTPTSEEHPRTFVNHTAMGSHTEEDGTNKKTIIDGAYVVYDDVAYVISVMVDVESSDTTVSAETQDKIRQISELVYNYVKPVVTAEPAENTEDTENAENAQ